MAWIPELPGVHSQGKTREEAREMVLSALQRLARAGLRVRTASVGKAADSESLQLTFAE